MVVYPRSSGPRTKFIKTRVTAVELRHVTDVAQALGITVSNYVRRLLFGNERGLVAGSDHVVAQNHAIRTRLNQDEQNEQSDEQAEVKMP